MARPALFRPVKTNALNFKILEALRTELMLQGLCAFAGQPVTTRIDGAIANVQALTMSGDCFATLGVRPQIGRAFTMAEDGRFSTRVALLTDSMWRRTFAASSPCCSR